MVDQAPEITATPVAATPVTTVTEAPVSTMVLEAPTVLGVEPEVKSEPVIAEPVKTETVAEAKPAVEPVKPVEAKIEPDVKQESAKTEEIKAPTYEAFTFPEGIKANDQTIGDFTSMLGSFESTTKASHEEVQKFGQALVDYHTARVQDTISELTKTYEAQWKKQTEDWHTQFMQDPEIGGKRMETSAKAANDFIRMHGGSAEQQKEFRDLMQKTGLGNHPSMIRMLANAGVAKNHTEGTLVPAQAPAPSKMGKLEKMYGRQKKR